MRTASETPEPDYRARLAKLLAQPRRWTRIDASMRPTAYRHSDLGSDIQAEDCLIYWKSTVPGKSAGGILLRTRDVQRYCRAVAEVLARRRVERKPVSRVVVEPQEIRRSEYLREVGRSV